MKFKTRVVPEKAATDLTSRQEFSARLVIELARRPGNLFVSPYSAWCLLAMLQPGARGATRDMLVRVLGTDEGDGLGSWTNPIEELTEEETPRKFNTLELKGPPESFPKSFFVKKRQFDLIVANALWLQKGYQLECDYREDVTERFKARIEELDLTGDPGTSCETINHWAEENTQGRIRKVLSPGEIGPLTRLILNNATYFKDKWRQPFQLDATLKKPFHRLDGSTVDVSMMHQMSGFNYFEDRRVQAVSLPYLYSGLSMIVILPKQIRDFEASLTPQSLESLFKSLEPSRVVLGLPRCRFEDGRSLVSALEVVGLLSLFDGSADLSGISREPGIGIDEVKQVTFVQIDEKGTEAAAVTTAIMTGAAPARPEPKPKVMIVDRPYWFFIRDDRSGTMLFAGRVEDPS